MKPTQETTEVESVDWQAVLVRVTCFPIVPAPVDAAVAERWWNEVAGAPPESVLSQNREGTWQGEGNLLGARGALVVTSMRHDWALSPPLPESQARIENPELPRSFGPAGEVMAHFAKTIGAWLDKERPALQRLALGAVLQASAADKVGSYGILQRLLPTVRLSPESSSDFQYQINRRRVSLASSEKALAINRLTKWAALKSYTVRLLSGGKATIPSTPESHFAQLELDINTPAGRTEALNGVDLGALLAEFAEYALEIAKRGDVA